MLTAKKHFYTVVGIDESKGNAGPYPVRRNSVV